MATGDVLEDKGDLHIHLLADDVAVLDEDAHVLNLAALHTAQRLGGTVYAAPDDVLETLVGDRACLCNGGYRHTRTFLPYSLFLWAPYPPSWALKRPRARRRTLGDSAPVGPRSSFSPLVT